MLAHLPGASDPLGEPSDWYVLLELAGAESDGGLDDALEAILTDAVEACLASDAAIAGSPAQRSALWGLREGISEVQKVEGATLKHDVTLPIADLAAWTVAMGPRLGEILPGVRPVTYGHVGDGNLHYNLNAPLTDGVSDDDALRAAPATSRRRSTTPWRRSTAPSAPSTASVGRRRPLRRRTSPRSRST